MKPILDIFFKAIQSGNLVKVKKLCQKDPRLKNAVDLNGNSALLTSVYNRQEAITDYLLSLNPELDFYEAAAIGNLKRVQHIFKEIPELINAYSTDGFTALGLACFFGQIEIVKWLLLQKAEVNLPSKNSLQVTPLHSAIAGRHKGIVSLLLAAGADVQAKQQQDYTPLHGAAATGDTEMAGWLIQKGANLDSQTKTQKTPLFIARERNHLSMVEFLQKRGAK